MLTLSGEIPYWASRENERCPHHIGGYDNLALSCMWKPDPALFGKFAQAVGTRYKGLVEYYSLWNETNLEHYLYPQFSRSKRGTVDLGGKMMRELWTAGYGAITKIDPSVKNKVLFGETAAISSPMDTLYAGLCLDEDGKPFRGWKKKAQGCTKPKKLPIGGLADPPVQQGRRGQRLHALVHQGLDGDGVRQPGHDRAAPGREVQADPARQGRLHHRVRLPGQAARQEGAQPAGPGARR